MREIIDKNGTLHHISDIPENYTTSDKVTTVALTAFKSIKPKNVVLGSSVKNLDYTLFYKSPVETVIIEGPITVLPRYTFAGTQNLKKVVLPDTLQIIEAEAFKDSSIEEIILPPHLTSIGARAFVGSGIRKITIPQSVTFIGQEAFASCNNLEYVSLPENLEIIKASCFAYNSKLNFDLLTLPKNLKEIHPYAFLTALDDDKKCEIYIPETVEIIGDHAFPNNSTLFVTEKQLGNNKHIKEFAHVDTSLEGKLNILLKEKALSLSQINKMFADKGR